MGVSLNHCNKMGAEPGSRFLKHHAAQLEPVINVFGKRRQIPAIGAFQ